MRINGNKLCPHCGFKHGLFRPFWRSRHGWDCPQCGRLLKSDTRREFLVILIPCLVLFVLLGLCETQAQRLLAITIAWFGFGSLMAYLNMDVRAAD